MASIALSTWLAAALVFIAVLMCVIALASGIEWYQERRRRGQIPQQLARLAQEGMGVGEAASVLRKVKGTGGLLDSVARHLPLRTNVAVLLEQSQVQWSPSTFVVLSVGFAASLGLGTLIATGSGIIAAIAAAVASTGPLAYLKRRRAQRLDRIEEALPEAIDLLGRSLRAGYPPSEGLKMIADEMEEPIAGEFRRVFEEQRFGMPFDETLLSLADRVPLMDVRIFVTAVLIQREVGGNLAEILDKLSYVIRQRFSIFRDIRSKTAQVRMSSNVLLGLPLGVGFVITLIDTERMMMFFDSYLGKLMVAAAIVFQVLGILWMRRITRIEV